MAINGVFYGATSNGWIKPRITWSAQTNTEGNYSDVTATLSYTRTNTGYTTSGYWGGKLSINGDAKSVSGLYVQIVNGTYTVTVSHTARVYHQDDGTKTITVSATGAISGTSLSYTTISSSIKLEAIPRAASIAATDGDIGAVSMVTVGKRSESYTHTVAYSFGTLQGYLAAEGLSDTPVQLTQASIPFALPEAFYYEIPNAPSGLCTLTCTTYRDDGVVGTPQQTTFTVRADPGRCAPVLQIQAVDTEPVTLALTGDESKFVRYASRVLCSLSCQGQFGAQITEKKIAGVSVSEDQLLIEQIDTPAVWFSVRDSRGYLAEKTLTAELIPYTLPTGRMTAARTDATSGKADIRAQGNWFSGSFGAADNALQVRCRVNNGQWQSLEAETEGDTFTVSAQLKGLTYTDSHTITLEVSDRITSISLSAHINPGIPVFDWGKEDFQFRVPVCAPSVTGLAAPVMDADAVNKAYVDGVEASLTAYADSLMSMTLLWENASPTSNFAAQTIALDLSGYDMVEIFYARRTTDTANLVSYRMHIGYAGTPVHFANLTASNDNIITHSRYTMVTAAGVTFQGGYGKYDYYGGAVFSGDYVMVPVRIYGIKGVIQ